MKYKIPIIIVIVAIVIFFSQGYNRTAVVGQSSFDYTYTLGGASFSIGDNVFGVSEPSMLCNVTSPVHSPNPSPSCWGTTIDFEGNKITITDGERKPINDYFDVVYTVDATLREKDGNLELHDNWVQNFHFVLTNPDFLELKIVDAQTVLSYGQPHNMELMVRNDLANNLEGGVVVYTSRELLNGQTETVKLPIKFKKGVNAYTLPVSTSSLGRQKITVLPYVTVGGIELIDDRAASILYNTLPSITELSTKVRCESRACPTGYVCESYLSENNLYKVCNKPVVLEEAETPIGTTETETVPQDSRSTGSADAITTFVFILLIVMAIYAIYSARGKK